MRQQFQRTEKLIGSRAQEKLNRASVMVLGLGGVGSYVCEALARAGVGRMTIVDKDIVDETNINRQLIALHSTIGMDKVLAQEARLKDINPDIKVEAVKQFYLPDSSGNFDFCQYDYIVDAVDNVTAKLDIIQKASEAGVPVISAMGTGNKLDPMAFKVALIEDTKVCPLAKVVRKELRKRGISGVKAVYSEEEPVKTDGDVPASISFVPSAAGLLIAKTVIDDIIKK